LLAAAMVRKHSTFTIICKFLSSRSTSKNTPPGVQNRQGCSFSERMWDACPSQMKASSLFFYHHVIEHVPDPEASLRELSRVLCNGGWMYIGTPNRRRVVGYLGSPNATWRQKVAWNLADYKARLRGRFRNELGAHAGFTQQELQAMLSPYFAKVQWLTADYLRFKYGGKLPTRALPLLLSRWGIQFLALAIHELCWKGETPPTAEQ
jgi:SAM-dependent methyltransferase